MLTITPGAAEQIRRAAASEAVPVLRVAATRQSDGAIDYGLGFDEWRTGDLRILCEGVVVVIAPHSRELLKEITIDYVEVAPGDFRFIFATASSERSAS